MQVALISRGWQTYHHRNKNLIRVMGLALLGITIGGVAISLSDNYFSYGSIQWYNWTILGLISAKSAFRIP